MRLPVILVTACVFVCMSAGYAVADEMTVGGSMKFYLYDSSDGRVGYWTTEVVEGETLDVYLEEDQDNGMSAGFSHVILNFYRRMNDVVGVEVQPEFSFRAGATPRLGGDIGRSPTGSASVSLLRCAAIWYAPGDFEIKGGYLAPLFTWDYGYELFWNEQFNGFRSSTSNGWHDEGVEIYKSFEGDGFSVPTYLYIVNGPDSDEGGDNNDGLTFMLHVAPEFMDGRLKFLGSYGTGKYDDGPDAEHSMTRYAVGADLRQGPFNVRGEYMAKTEENAIADGVDAEPFGYYAKAFYSATPELTFVGGISHNENDDGSQVYDEWLIGANYSLGDGVVVMLSYASTEAEETEAARDDDPVVATLEYTRLNLGVQVTF